MVKVKLMTNLTGEIVAFEVRGHARYADHGQDIVCAGTSAVAQTAVLGLEHFADGEVKLKIKKGYLYCALKDSLSSVARERGTIILQTMALGLEMIARSYPQNVQLVWESIKQ